MASQTTDQLLALITDKAKMEKGIAFYQFVTEVLEFCSSEHNFNQFFASMSATERQEQLRNILLQGNKLLFDDNATYRDWISNIFNTKTKVGTISALVLKFMILIQNSFNNQGKLSGDAKQAFVHNAVESYLKFTDLSDQEKQTIVESLDGIIQAYVLVKNGALKTLISNATEIIDIVEKTGCCGFFGH